MNHPYEEFENTSLWLQIKKALNDLTENQDIEIKTRPEYVIGFLCKKLSNEQLSKKGKRVETDLKES